MVFQLGEGKLIAATGEIAISVGLICAAITAVFVVAYWVKCLLTLIQGGGE